jgi:alpha-L-rhamnosidase
MSDAGKFQSSNTTLNQIFTNAYWGIRSNYKGMPVDCPQRNERQPWLGDRTTGAYGESYLFDNHTLYTKWLDDIEQSQKADGSIPDVAPSFWRYYGDNVTWPATYITIADMLYQQFGDAEPIKKHYPSMKKWAMYMAEKYTENGLITKDKYGDWCVPPESKELIHAKDESRLTDGKLLATATYIRVLQLMQKFAQILII